jgi:hypothetical protein
MSGKFCTSKKYQEFSNRPISYQPQQWDAFLSCSCMHFIQIIVSHPCIPPFFHPPLTLCYKTWIKTVITVTLTSVLYDPFMKIISFNRLQNAHAHKNSCSSFFCHYYLLH